MDFQVEPPNEQSSGPSDDLKMVNFSDLPNPPCDLPNSMDSQVFIALIPVVIEVIYKMNWLVCFVGGTCHGALEEISMSLIFLVRGRVKLIFVQLQWSSQISFFSRVSWISLLNAVVSRGQTIRIPHSGPELIDFSSLLIEKPSFPN